MYTYANISFLLYYFTYLLAYIENTQFLFLSTVIQNRNNIEIQLFLIYTFSLLIINILKTTLTSDNVNISKMLLHDRVVKNIKLINFIHLSFFRNILVMCFALHLRQKQLYRINKGRIMEWNFVSTCSRRLPRLSFRLDMLSR